MHGVFRWKLVFFRGSLEALVNKIIFGSEEQEWEDDGTRRKDCFCVWYQTVEDKIMSATETLFLKACMSITCQCWILRYHCSVVMQCRYRIEEQGNSSAFCTTGKYSLEFGSGHFYTSGFVFWSICIQPVFSVCKVSLLICPSLVKKAYLGLLLSCSEPFSFCLTESCLLYAAVLFLHGLLQPAFLANQLLHHATAMLFNSLGLCLVWERCDTLALAVIDTVKQVLWVRTTEAKKPCPCNSKSNL